ERGSGVRPRPAATRVERVQATAVRIPADRVRAAPLGCDGLDMLEPVAVETADNAWVTDRNVEAVQVRVVGDDVGHPPQREGREQISRGPIEHEQSAAVGGAEQPARVEPETLRPPAPGPARSLDRWALAGDDHDLRWLQDVGADEVALLVVDGPARPPG